MAPSISLSPNLYSVQAPAHRFRQGGRDVYYFALDLATLDGLLPQRVDDSVVREANRRLTPSHARNIQEYLETRPDWVLGAMLLGIAPNAVEFELFQNPEGEVYGENFGMLSIRTNRANTMRIFDGQHRRRAIQDTLERLSDDNGDTDRLAELQQSSVPIVLYAEEDVKALRLMFVDASQSKRIEGNVVTRFDQRDAFNRAAIHISDNSLLFSGRVEMDRTTVARSGRALLAVNQLAQYLKTLEVGHDRRVSRERNELFMQDLDDLFERCVIWSDEFLPAARQEYEGLASREIVNDEIPYGRTLSLAYSATFLHILAGCYHDWCSEHHDWKPLAEFIREAVLEPEGGRGTLLVDAGAMAPGDTSLMARRQEVDGAIKYIVQQAKSANL